MRTFPVSGAEISICGCILTGAIRVCLALHIRTFTKFKNLVLLFHTLLYLRWTGKDREDIKVKLRANLLYHTEFLSRGDFFIECADL